MHVLARRWLRWTTRTTWSPSKNAPASRSFRSLPRAMSAPWYGDKQISTLRTRTQPTSRPSRSCLVPAREQGQKHGRTLWSRFWNPLEKEHKDFMRTGVVPVPKSKIKEVHCILPSLSWATNCGGYFAPGSLGRQGAPAHLQLASAKRRASKPCTACRAHTGALARAGGERQGAGGEEGGSGQGDHPEPVLE